MARVLLCAPNGDVARYSMPRSSMDCRIGMPAGCWGKEEECSVISPTQREDEDGLIRAIIELASQYGRYGLTSENLLAL